MNIQIKKITSQEDFQRCLDIRTKIFVDGQKVPVSEELDGKDESSDHYLLFVDSHPVGVTRVRFIENDAKIERVAILESYQGQGFGKMIMQKILSDLKQHPRVDMIKLSSQVHAIPFYEKLGFKVCSEAYEDAGIPHKDMQLRFVKTIR